MSQREINKLQVMEQLSCKQLKQADAAAQLGISVRQVRRLWSGFKREGATALLSCRRGKPSNHQCPQALKETALALIHDKYADFGPTLAAEYLLEHDNVILSVETIRQMMIKAGLWTVKHSRAHKRVHQQRERRPCFGELVQLDGSTHDWFEGRGPKCCLHVLIDDATSAILGLYFDTAESTFGYFSLLEAYLLEHGLPVALYSDKHGIFRINKENAKSGNGQTQFSRAAKELGIDLIYAHSPQAKGRVERANNTLQDRLIKAMRLRGICSIEEANAFLPEYREDHNKRFAKPPKNEANAHRELTFKKAALAHILCRQTYRTLTKNLECSSDNVTYQIKAQERTRRLQNKKVQICETRSGEITIFYNGKSLPFERLDPERSAELSADDKTLNHIVDGVLGKTVSVRKPAADHPWRHFGVKRNACKSNQHQTAHSV
jgi:hypothetical protein